MGGKYKEMELNIPFLTYKWKSKKTNKITTRLCTFNAFVNMHRMVRHKIKVEYKELIKDWFLEDLEKGYHRAKIELSPIYNNKKARDSDGITPTAKYFTDCLVDLGILVDDDKTTLIINERSLDLEAQDNYVIAKLTLSYSHDTEP